jgi:hypothetical protein
MFWSAQEMGVNALMLYLTVISGYLVVAFVVGARLTRPQAQFVSALFVVFACYALWGVGQYWWSGDMARAVLEAGPMGEHIELNALGMNPAKIAVPMGFVGIAGALKFMWDVRSERMDD